MDKPFRNLPESEISSIIAAFMRAYSSYDDARDDWELDGMIEAAGTIAVLACRHGLVTLAECYGRLESTHREELAEREREQAQSALSSERAKLVKMEAEFKKKYGG